MLPVLILNCWAGNLLELGALLAPKISFTCVRPNFSVGVLRSLVYHWVVNHRYLSKSSHGVRLLLTSRNNFLISPWCVNRSISSIWSSPYFLPLPPTNFVSNIFSPLVFSGESLYDQATECRNLPTRYSYSLSIFSHIPATCEWKARKTF